jgi:hypothetical protein
MPLLSSDALLSEGAGVGLCCSPGPPYYGLIDYGHRGEYGHEGSVGAYLSCLERVFALVGAGMIRGGVVAESGAHHQWL